MLKKIATTSVCLLLCISLTACKKPAFLEKLNFFKKQPELSINELAFKARQGDLDALKRLQEAAEQNDANAQNRLGVIYADGKGVLRNENLAADWFQKAAELENAEAQANLAALYRNSLVVPRDNAKVIYWAQKAAEHGNPRGQNILGFMYMIGEGVQQDDAKAVSWYQKAAEQGFAGGQRNLAFMYLNGKGVPQDDATATYWYQKAANQGDIQAQKSLKMIQEKSKEMSNYNLNTVQQSPPQASSHQPLPKASPSNERNLSPLKNIFDKLKQNSAKMKSAPPGNEEQDYLK